MRREIEMGGIDLLEGRKPGASFRLTALGKYSVDPRSYRMRLLNVSPSKRVGKTVFVALGEGSGDARGSVLFVAVVRQDGTPVSATLIRDCTSSSLERAIVSAGGESGEDVA